MARIANSIAAVPSRGFEFSQQWRQSGQSHMCLSLEYAASATVEIVADHNQPMFKFSYPNRFYFSDSQK